jgi:hypothetical protein
MQTQADHPASTERGQEPVEHVLKAANAIMGSATFLTMNLGPDWGLAPGVGHPEVTASHERSGVRWVANGDFWYVIFNQNRGWTMEVRGRFRPGVSNAFPREGETADVGGHAASVRWHMRRRGLPWRRHDVRYMTVVYECPASERKILLEFSGWCEEAGFRQVLESLKSVKCH